MACGNGVAGLDCVRGGSLGSSLRRDMIFDLFSGCRGTLGAGEWTVEDALGGSARIGGAIE